MPLPAALVARLAKRGIVDNTKGLRGSKSAPATGNTANDDEEVFAESYDEPALLPPPDDESQEAMVISDHGEIDMTEEEEMLIREVSGCPNKVNKFHECCAFCSERWGLKPFNHSPTLDLKRLNMLKKHPLPENWEEVGDPEMNRYYYWNTLTDEVSWLPPTHPRTQISLPTDRLKELFESAREEAESEGEDDDEGDIMDIDDFEEIERKILMEKSAKDKEKKGREKKRREEPLDPMDPAAYSEVPRGNWSSGLELKGSAKTGVDSTVSGPLYQQRPYPSPGAILRMNKQMDN